LADLEEQRRRKSADPYVSPRDFGVGEHFEDGAEEQREEEEAQRQVDAPDQRGGDAARQEGAELFGKGGDDRTEKERDEQEQRDDQHHPQREDTLEQEVFQPALFRVGLDLPGGVERRLKLRECAGGTKEQAHHR